MEAIVSIPHSRIYTVAAEDEYGLLMGQTSEIAIMTPGDEYEFEFR